MFLLQEYIRQDRELTQLNDSRIKLLPKNAFHGGKRLLTWKLINKPDILFLYLFSKIISKEKKAVDKIAINKNMKTKWRLWCLTSLLLAMTYTSRVVNAHEGFTSEACLAAHNKLRALHVDTNDVQYDPDLEVLAKEKAEFLQFQDDTIDRYVFVLHVFRCMSLYFYITLFIFHI